MDISPMMMLPEEIRGVILNFIPQNESVNIRLVCKTWNQEVQNYYEYDIDKLNENSPHFKSILQLRIKTLKIHRLKTTPLVNFNLTSIFKRPNSIRSLIIEKAVPIPQLNLQLLIGHFSENLQYLQINVSVDICNFTFPNDLRYDFKHLKSLKIMSQDDGEVTPLSSVNTTNCKCDKNPRSLFQVLEDSSFPKLLHLHVNLLKIGMTVAAKSRVVGNLLRLVSNQGRFLTKLGLIFYPNLELTKLPVRIKKEELLRMKQIDTITSFLVYLDPVVSKQFWKEFLFQQKKLTELSVFHTLSTYRFLDGQIFLKHSATLKLLHLEFTTTSINWPFDLSIFKSCVSLKTLKLLNNVLRSNMEPDVKNFQCLPEQISNLDFRNIKTLSQELLMAFQCNDKFQELEELKLVNCGNNGPFGVNGLVLSQIMMNPRPSLVNVDFSGGVHKGTALATLLSQLHIYTNADSLKLERKSGDGCERWSLYQGV